jgi:alkanesulfonate monooxygenase SsuD/methylene tetrahydromethanopterin reductase-like flavin-dependent oxidoreductase (luciferase family)
VRTSVMISNFSWAAAIADELDRVAAIVDEARIDSVFVADHLVQAEPGTDPSEPMLESLATLAHLAARTTRVRLGTMVASATLRPAAVLVKAVTTIDVLSHGRAWFGIGAGYQQAEADAMGVPLPAVGDRFDTLEDTLQLARRMWSGDATPFNGRRVHAGHPIGNPAPTTIPHPPILIGGSGERRTLRLVARHADACNLPDVGDSGEFIRHKLAILAAHCATEGRPFEAIEKTVSTRLEPGEPAAAFVARAAALAALGLDHLVVVTRGPWTAAALAVLAGAVPELRTIPAATPALRIDHQEHRA